MKVVRTQEEIGNRKYVGRVISKKRQDLINNYMSAYYNNDPEKMVRFRKKMATFNKRHEKMFYGYRITEGNLRNSKKARDKIRSSGSADGVPLSDNLRGYLDYTDELYRRGNVGDQGIPLDP